MGGYRLKHSASRAFLFAATAAVVLAFGCSGQTNSGATTEPTPAASSTLVGNDLLDQVKKRGVLVISTDADYTPQSYRNADGTWVGFDIDVAREIAKRLGVKTQFVTPTFDLVTAGGWNGRWDVNIDSMAITKERARLLWFTEPYYFVPASFA